jgi:hypothetical protein
VALAAEHLALTGADSPFLIDILLLSPPRQGTLLRDGFALAEGDVFTQEDIDRGRICYRHDGAAGEDGFTFATPEGEVPPTEFRFLIVATRHAPRLTGPGRLGRIHEGRTVADLLGGTALSSEADVAPGVAVVAARGRGEWAYSLDGGATWLLLGEIHPRAALLLEPTHQIRFIPCPGWSGRAALTYRAWDRSAHASGRRLDLSPLDAVGGATAFSLAVTTATATIRPACETLTEPWRGQPTATDLLGSGLAVVRLEGPGVWQYSLDDGRTWLDAGEVYHGRALLLEAEDRLRFLPRPGACGKVAVAGRPWDGGGGAGGEFVNLSRHGSSGDGTPFSAFVQTRAWRLGGV